MIPTLITEKTMVLAEILRPLVSSWQGLLVIFGDCVFDRYSEAMTLACGFPVKIKLSEGASEHLLFECPDECEPEITAAVQLAYAYDKKTATLIREGQCSEMC
jgi:hypothetical protein